MSELRRPLCRGYYTLLVGLRRSLVSDMADPAWPELSFYELLKIAYRDRMITSLEHPVVKRLRGLV